MSRREEYEQRTEKLLQPIMEDNKYELVDVEYIKENGSWILRAYVDKEGGITINDCENVNRALSEIMDREDFIPDSYILEISSPGLGRQLKKDKDLHRSIGKDVEVKLYKAMTLMEEGIKVTAKEFVGRLVGYDNQTIQLDVNNEEALILLRKDIAMIRLALNF